MKKLLKIVFCLAVLFISLPVIAFAQDGESIIPGLDLTSYFVSLAALVPLVILLSGWLNKVIKAKGFGIQFITWLISIALVYIGWAFKLGLFAEITQWYIILIYGIATGLVANGIFDIKLIQMFLNYIKLIPHKDQTK